MKSKSIKVALLPLIILFFIPYIYSLEECPGEIINPEDSPCFVLLPYSGNCSIVTLSLYNKSNFLYNQSLNNYSVNQCSGTFNQTDIGTYAFFWDTGDTGSIIIEVDNMIDIFHVFVYAILGIAGMVFIFMMHNYREDNTSMVYGSISSAIWLIMAVINISGFNLIRNVTFIVDINYYITALFVILCLYTGTAAYFFYKEDYKKVDNPYGLRQ